MTAEPRVASVTGSTSGIGLAIAQRLAHAGYAVALHSRNSPETGLRQAAALADAALGVGRAPFAQNDKKIRSKSAIKMAAVAHRNTSGWGVKPFAGQRASAPNCPEDESVRARQGASPCPFLSSFRTPSIRPRLNRGEMRRSAGLRSLPGSVRRGRHWTDEPFSALPGYRYPVGRQGPVPGERGKCSPNLCCYPGDSR